MLGWSGKKKMFKLFCLVRVGVIFLVGRLMCYLKKGMFKYWISVGVFVYMVVVIEYLVVEILELVGNVVRDNKKVWIVLRYILLVVVNDEEFN